jgi:hypothetical protein
MKDINSFKLKNCFYLMGQKDQKFINAHEWGAGSFRVNLFLSKDLKQFEKTDDALAEGYIPFGAPRAWALGSQNFYYKPNIDHHGNRQTIADLVLDEVDAIWNQPDAYVIGATRVTESEPRENGGPEGEYFTIGIQFYIKDKKK